MSPCDVTGGLTNNQTSSRVLAHACNQRGLVPMYLVTDAQVVNGPKHPGAVGAPPAKITPPPPKAAAHGKPPPGWRDVLIKEGPEGWAKAVRAHQGVLLTDTTMCATLGCRVLVVGLGVCGLGSPWQSAMLIFCRIYKPCLYFRNNYAEISNQRPKLGVLCLSFWERVGLTYAQGCMALADNKCFMYTSCPHGRAVLLKILFDGVCLASMGKRRCASSVLAIHVACLTCSLHAPLTLLPRHTCAHMSM